MNNKFTNPLGNIKIASPCKADWNQMIGDERQRFCGECKLNVYNLSGMSKTEAEKLLANSEGRLCVRYFKRADGTVLTKDCPVGWQAIKRRVSRTAAACASLLFGIVNGLGLAAYFTSHNETTMGTLAYNPTPKPTPKTPPIPLMGAVAPQRPTPKPTATPKATPEEYTMGKIAVPPKPKTGNNEE